MSYSEDLLYTEDHEWVRVAGNRAHVGITNFAQDQLGDVVYVELPEVGQEFDTGDAFGVVESVKTVADLYMPVGGKIVEVNERLLDEPEVVNDSPHDDGWMVVIELLDADELDDLLNSDEYEDHIADE